MNIIKRVIAALRSLVGLKAKPIDNWQPTKPLPEQSKGGPAP